MEDKRETGGTLPLHKTKSHDSVHVEGRRRSSIVGGGWLKKLGSKITGAETNHDDHARRRGSVSSMNTADSDAESGSVGSPLTRTSSGRSAFRFGRPRGSSSASNLAPESVASSSEPPAHLEPANPTRRAPARARASLEDLQRDKVNTRMVGFALSTFEDNPPQRIPPATPVQGNVEFLPNGDLQLRKRPHQQRWGGDPGQYLDKNHHAVTSTAQEHAQHNAERLHATLHQGTSTLSALLHGNPTQSMMNAAASVSVSSPEEHLDRNLATHDVDGVSRFSHDRGENHWDQQTPAPAKTTDSIDGWENHQITQDKTPSPDEIYTRCCHLREIMPIKNVLRQLKGQLAPIPRMRIANTQPTLVEVEAFSDFLTIVPVASIVLDNHILTAKMVRLILGGLTRSRDIARITFVNTELDTEAWQYLCAFLATGKKSLLALSLACTNPTGVPSRLAPFDRRNADWGLFTQALQAMGTLEELDLSGTLIGREDMRNLLTHGFSRGKVLGLANNKLDHDDVQFLVDWSNRPEAQLMGINLSGNDLSREQDWVLVQSFIANPRILQLSLRNANLSNFHASQIVKAVNPEKAEKSNLRAIDLSMNPLLFRNIMGLLIESLPKFPYLSRLMLDNCGLSNESIVVLCEALAQCHRLVYVSLVGNAKLTETTGTALCVAVHLSKSICTVEADMDDWSVPLRQQLARYCLQNLETNAGALSEQAPDENSDITNFNDDLKAVAKDIRELRNVGSAAPINARVEDLRKRMQERMQRLLAKRKNGPLNVSDREATIRLYFFMNNLDRLQREALDPGSSSTTSAPGSELEEQVENVDEEAVRPAISRQASRSSILSLKKLDREEGETHKVNTEKFRDSYDPNENESMTKLRLYDLEKIMS